MFPSRVLFEHLVLFLIYILLFTDQKKKKKFALLSSTLNLEIYVFEMDQ